MLRESRWCVIFVDVITTNCVVAVNMLWRALLGVLSVVEVMIASLLRTEFCVCILFEGRKIFSMMAG